MSGAPSFNVAERRLSGSKPRPSLVASGIPVIIPQSAPPGIPCPLRLDRTLFSATTPSPPALKLALTARTQRTPPTVSTATARKQPLSFETSRHFIAYSLRPYFQSYTTRCARTSLRHPRGPIISNEPHSVELGVRLFSYSEAEQSDIFSSFTPASFLSLMMGVALVSVHTKYFYRRY